MQKHQLFFLSLLTSVFYFSLSAQASLQFLPRYQGGYSGHTQSGGKDKVTVSCSSKGGVEKGINQTCSGPFSAGGKTCYKSCSCSAGYKMSGGSCVLKVCSDYGYQPYEDTSMSCEMISPRSGLTCYSCTSCNSSIYKYGCSGGLNSSYQGSYNKCGNNYSECSCVSNAGWIGSDGKCVCNSGYKQDGSSCILKTCSDYGFQSTNDTTKDCSEETPQSGLTCYNCQNCDSSYQYNCETINHADSGDGTACGGKYAKCKCKSGYFWDNGSCSLSCTPCSSSEYPLSSQAATKATAYETCSCNGITKYKVTACEEGYAPTASGGGCKLTCTYKNTSCSDAYEITDSCRVDGETFYKCELCHRPGGTAEGLYYCYHNDGSPETGTGGFVWTPTPEVSVVCGNKNYRTSCGCESGLYFTRPKLDAYALCGEEGYRGQYVNNESWYYRGYLYNACEENGKSVSISGCAAYSCVDSGYKVVKAPVGTCATNSAECCCPENSTEEPNSTICKKVYKHNYDPADYN